MRGENRARPDSAQGDAHIRNATRADLQGILAVEEGWPLAARAGADKFASRLERFAAGFFAYCIEENGQEKIAATITSMPFNYDPQNLESCRTWDAVTNRGYLHDAAARGHCNAIYIVSGVIGLPYRGLDIFRPMVLRVVRLAQEMGMRYVAAGAVIPGYRDYCETNGETDAYAYCRLRRGRRLVDPLLARYEPLEFRVPDARHVIPDYFPDDASRNYAAFVVRDLARAPL